MEHKKINDKRRLLQEEYPANLLKAIFGASEVELPVEITFETLTGLEAAVSTLSIREQNLLHLRYRERKTLRELGAVFYITPSRVRQVELAALRKLRKPTRWQMITPHTHDTQGVRV